MKNTISKTKFKYKDTVGFTADVGGRGFHIHIQFQFLNKMEIF